MQVGQSLWVRIGLGSWRFFPPKIPSRNAGTTSRTHIFSSFLHYTLQVSFHSLHSHLFSEHAQRLTIKQRMHAMHAKLAQTDEKGSRICRRNVSLLHSDYVN